MTTLEDRLKDPEYRLWVKSVLCFQLTRDALVTFCDENADKLFKKITSKPCSNCGPYICSICVKKLETYRCDQKRALKWNNSDSNRLLNHRWQLAKLYMNSGQDPNDENPKNTDTSGLLNFIEQCDIPRKYFTNPGILKQVRETRNRLIHTPTMTTTQNDFTGVITPLLITFLQAVTGPDANAAVKGIKEIQMSDFMITKEDEMKVFNERLIGLTKKVEELRGDLTEVKREKTEDITNLQLHVEENKLELAKVQDTLGALRIKIDEDSILRKELMDKVATVGNDIKETQNAWQQPIACLTDDFRELKVRVKYLEEEKARTDDAQNSAKLEVEDYNSDDSHKIASSGGELKQEFKTDESLNFFMLAHLVMDTGAFVFRKLLLKDHHLLTCQIKKLLKGRLFNSPQLQEILKQPLEPENNDISFTKLFLKLTCPGIYLPTKGWNLSQDLDDTSIGDDLKRLLDVKNNCLVLHAPSTLLNRCQFNKSWVTAKIAILRLAFGINTELGNKVQEQIRELETGRFEFSVENKLRLTEILQENTIFTLNLQVDMEALEDRMEAQKVDVEGIKHSLKELQQPFTNENEKDCKDYSNPFRERFLKSLTLSKNENRKIQQEEENDDISCVTIIKMYPCIKKELGKKMAISLSKKVLPSDEGERVIHYIDKTSRRLGIDRLLKYVVQFREAGYSRRFLDQLKDHLKGSPELENEFNSRSAPTRKEIEDYRRLNERRERLSSAPRTSSLVLPDDVKKDIAFAIKNFVTIDTLNDCFLSRFFYGLLKHEEVCECLHKNIYGEGVDKLLNLMQTCPSTIMRCFCDTLITKLKRKKTVQDLDLMHYAVPTGLTEDRETAAAAELTEDPVVLYDRGSSASTYLELSEGDLQAVIENFKPPTGYYLDCSERGSVWFFLKANIGTKDALNQLKVKCEEANVKELLDNIIPNDKMFDMFAFGGCSVLMTIYKEDSNAVNNKVGETLVLKYDIKDLNSEQSEDAAVSFNNTRIASHMRLLCEEMELTDDIIIQLQLNRLVGEDIREKITRITTRAGRIHHLLTSISDPDRGYEIIKEYQRSTNHFLYEELCKRDQRKLLFQCEAKLQASQDGSVSDAKHTWHIIHSSCFFRSEEIPVLSESMVIKWDGIEDGKVNVNCPTTASTEKHADLSIKLRQVLKDKGVTKKTRDASVRLQTHTEVLQMLIHKPSSQLHIFGSQYEGVNTPSMKADLNCVREFESPEIITNSIESVGEKCLLVVDDQNPGFVKLQLVWNAKCLGKDDVGWLMDNTALWNTFDEADRLVCYQKHKENCVYEWTGPVPGIWQNELPLNMKYGFKCNIWPSCATKWLSRGRRYNWPPQSIIDTCKSLGCLFLSQEQPNSETPYAWEVSFLLQERLLMKTLNSTQMQTLTFLKLIKTEFLKSTKGHEIITSYHCKTCLFFVIENLPSRLWRKGNMAACIIACLEVLLEWTKCAYCPNYFVPARNMFGGLLSKELQKELIEMLLEVMADLDAASKRIRTDDIGLILLQFQACTPTTASQQRNLQRLLDLRSTLPVISMACCARNQILKNQCTKKLLILDQLLMTMKKFLDTKNVKGHTELETTPVINILLTFIQPTFVANLVAKRLQSQAQPLVIKNLLTCERLYDLEKTWNTADIKKAVIYFNQKNYVCSEELLRKIRWCEKVSLCGCRSNFSVFPKPEDIASVADRMKYDSSEDALYNVLTPCVVFLPTEAKVTPLPIMYETLRSVGMPPGTRNETEDYWYDWAVVDGQFLVQFMMWFNEAVQGKCSQTYVNLKKMLKVIETGNVSHLETCYNLLGWMCLQHGSVDMAMDNYLKSLSIKKLYNAAYWHLAFLFAGA